MEEENKLMENQLEIGDEKSNAIAHKDLSLKRLDKSFVKHIELNEYKKSDLLAYWINDFSEYHDNERTFDPSTLRTFKRGDIIKVNLGFNIGNELGGLHYCVVLNKHDNPKSGLLNIIPLSSAKNNKKYNSNTCINLGDSLYSSLKSKFTLELTQANKELSELISSANNEYDIDATLRLSMKVQHLKKLDKEISKMKHGSYALINQITTISKQRIFRTSILSGIKLNSKGLDAIDNKIKDLYTNF